MQAEALTVGSPRRRQLAMQPPEVDELAKVLGPLSEPNRLRIFALLTKGELCVCELTEILGLRQSLVSNHLRVLRRLGLVHARRDEVDNRWVYYSLDLPAVEKLRAICLDLFDLSRMDREPARCGSEPPFYR